MTAFPSPAIVMNPTGLSVMRYRISLMPIRLSRRRPILWRVSDIVTRPVESNRCRPPALPPSVTFPVAVTAGATNGAARPDGGSGTGGAGARSRDRGGRPVPSAWADAPVVHDRRCRDRATRPDGHGDAPRVGVAPPVRRRARRRPPRRSARPSRSSRSRGSSARASRSGSTACTSWCGPTPTTPAAARIRSGGGVARRRASERPR